MKECKKEDCCCSQVPETLTVSISTLEAVDCPEMQAMRDAKMDEIFGIGMWRRWCEVSVDLSLFLLMTIQPGKLIEVVSNDVPADAKLIHSYFDGPRSRVVLILEHPSFPASAIGSTLTWLKGIPGEDL